MPMTADELAYLSLADAARLIRARELSPLELTRALLERIEALQPQLNVFVTVAADLALAQAQAAERALADSGRRCPGPLYGVPVAIKDLFDVKGLPTTAGSPLRRQHLAAADAYCVARLRAAGAIILGKTLTHEWALGTTTINPHFGPTRNPWHPALIAGGSSGGNAAGLAAGLFGGALGSDTGGSVRIPAALCGVVGLKPTRGRLSLTGAVPLSWTLDHPGPMARSVVDTALLLAVMDGFDRHDPASASPPPGAEITAVEGHLTGTVIGVPGDYFWEEVDPEVEQPVRAAIELLEGLGARVRELPSLEWQEAFTANGQMLLADAAAVHTDHLGRCPELIGADVLARLRQGEQVSGPQYARARRTQACWRRRLEDLFRQVNLMAAPTTPVPAQPIATTNSLAAARQLTSLTAPFNLTGLPAISVPCGFTSTGLPVGLQLVGPWWQEQRLLDAAAAYQAATDWHLRRPPLPAHL